jgi:YfiH family protein
MKWRERDGLRWLEAELPGARAAFTTRLGGVSEGPFASLNLGLLTGDERDAVRANRHRASRALEFEPARVLFGRQVHGAELERREAAPAPNPFAVPGGELRQVDGQVTSTEGLVPLVLVADCLPIALSGAGGVAVLHCGWRGLAAGIVARGVEAVGADAATIGPGIGRCCYEVGDEVRERFVGLGDGVADGRRLDLAEVARRLLAAAGVADVEVAGLCTSCESALFYSHRRDGPRCGRQAGAAWLDGDG